MKVVLITGCSSGLGKLTAEALADEGHTVYAGLRKPSEVLEFSKIFNDRKLKIFPLKLDITNKADCQKVIETIIKKEKRIDVIINNAGYTIIGPMEQYSDKDFINILDTNVVGAFRLIKAGLPIMRQRRSGHIINITSLNGLLAAPNFSLYCASKFALEALGRSVSFELRKYNIKVTNVEPGAIKTEDEVQKKSLPHIPAREKFLILRFLLPMIKSSQVARRIVELVNDSNPPRSLILGADAKITTFFNRFLPQVIWGKLIQAIWDR